MEGSEKVAYCHECFNKLTVGKTENERQFVASEGGAGMTGTDMKFDQGMCSKCGKEGEVIFYRA